MMPPPRLTAVLGPIHLCTPCAHSITGTIVNAGNYDSVIEELSTDIARAQPIIIQPSPELAQEMPRCYQWLRDAYGGSLSQDPSTAACSLQS